MVSELYLDRLRQQRREAEFAKGLMIAAWVVAMGTVLAVFAS